MIDDGRALAGEELVKAGWERLRAQAILDAEAVTMPVLGPEVPLPGTVNFRIGFFDFETGGLLANYGRVLVMAVADAKGDVELLRADDEGRDPLDDADLVTAARDVLESYQVLVSWYGRHFDIRYLNGRLMIAGARPMRPPMLHFDLKDVSRRELAWQSHSLDAVARTLRVPFQKTPLSPDAMAAAMDGQTWGLDNLAEHCVRDALVTRAVFARYMDLLRGSDG